MYKKTLALALALTFALISAACSDDTDSNNKADDGGVADKSVVKKDTGGTQKDTGGTQKDQAVVKKDTGSTPNCSGCHGFPPTTGEHTKHKAKGMKCSGCHSEVVDSSNKIISVTKHKDGTKDIKGSFTWDAKTKSCSNIGCHGTKSW